MTDTRAEIDALIEQGKNITTLDRYGLIGWGVDITAALAAERDRADALAKAHSVHVEEDGPVNYGCAVCDNEAEES